MRFFLVHELSCSNGAGRLRARACRPMTQVQAEILADTLDAIDGVEGVRDGYIYEKGRRLEIEDGLRYGIVEYDGEAYLVNQSGKIQKNKKNAKDSDGVYYSSDKDGIVIHQGDKQE